MHQPFTTTGLTGPGNSGDIDFSLGATSRDNYEQHPRKHNGVLSTHIVDKDQHGHPPTRISYKTQIPTNGDSASNRNFGQNVKETAQAHGALVLVGKNELEVS